MINSLRIASIAIVFGIGVHYGLRIDVPLAVAAEQDSQKWFSAKVETAPTVVVDNSSNAGGAADDRNAFHVLPGYKVEHLFSVPKAELGSWVSMTTDNKGRLIVSDQEGKGLCRVTPPAVGSDGETKVEHLDAKIASAQGLLYAFGSLYVSVNRGRASALYRLRDTNGDDQFDEVVKLRDLHGPAGEHGPHALRLSPNGKSIFLVCGNHTDPPFDVAEMKTHPEFKSRLPSNWNEDLLLPRIWDPNGHARGRMAPGGYIVQTDPEGKSWNIFTMGYRNSYDFDFNADGEIIVYDSDMEWDMGLPWYRATRIVHATDGSELGWRSGAGVWPWYFVDSVPPIADMGPGSPVGVTFGYGAKFPAKYQKAFFACDWTFGTIYAIHLEPEGSSYKAVKEEFLSRNALPLTDIVIGNDGAMYFTVGGRNSQSDLFRVTYVGAESTAPVDAHDPRGAAERELRHKIEAFHGKPAENPQSAVAFLWPYLVHADRFIRYAARVALEYQPVETWQDRVFSANNPETQITAAVALAHQGPSGLQARLFEVLGHIDFAKLTTFQQLELLRAYELALIRMGTPDEAAHTALVKRLDPLFPSQNDLVNRELCNLLSFLQSPTIVAKTMPLLSLPNPPADEQFGELLGRNKQYAAPIQAMIEHHPDRQKIAYAYALRVVKQGWTLQQRKAFFEFLREAGRASGGHSFVGFLRNIDHDAYETCNDRERLALEAIGARKPFTVPTLPKPKGPGKEWTMDVVLQAAQSGLQKRDFENGKKMYAAARCVVCHRFGGDGGATGPDLTQLAGRFNLKDLTGSIVDPSKVIAEQYKASIVVTRDGKSYTGRIVDDSNNKVVIVVDPEDSTKTVQLAKDEIEEEHPSPVSLMPGGLLKPLNEPEVLDLLAYLLSRGNPQDAMFQK